MGAADISARLYSVIGAVALAVLIVVPGGISVQSQGEPAWEVVDARLSQVAVGPFYQVDSRGHVAESEVVLDIVSVPFKIDFEYPFTVATSPWLDKTLMFVVVPGYEIPPGVEDPCSPVQTPVGLYDAHNNSYTLSCIDTPFLAFDEALAPLQRNPWVVDQVFARNRYLVDLQSGDVQDISATFPSQVNPADSASWIAHDYTWWDPATHLPVAQVRDRYTLANNVPQGFIQMCPILAGDCETLVDVESYVHGTVDDLIISPDGQYILWSAAVFPAGVQIQGGNPMGLVGNFAAFQTKVSTGETIQIFDLQDYDTSGAVGQNAHWSPDARGLVVSLFAKSGFPHLSALFVTFAPVIQGAVVGGTVWHDANGDGLQTPDELSTGAAGLTVSLYDEFDSMVSTTTTDSAGYYTFDVLAGTPYTVGVEAPGYGFSPANTGSDDNLDSDIDPTTGHTGNIVVGSHMDDESQDIGLVASADSP